MSVVYQAAVILVGWDSRSKRSRRNLDENNPLKQMLIGKHAYRRLFAGAVGAPASTLLVVT